MKRPSQMWRPFTISTFPQFRRADRRNNLRHSRLKSVALVCMVGRPTICREDKNFEATAGHNSGDVLSRITCQKLKRPAQFRVQPAFLFDVPKSAKIVLMGSFWAACQKVPIPMLFLCCCKSIPFPAIPSRIAAPQA